MTLREARRPRRRELSLGGEPDAVRAFLFEGGVRLGRSLALLVIGYVPVSFLTWRALVIGPQRLLGSWLVTAGGTVRKLIAKRFHPLMTITARVRSISSFSLKL